MKRTWPIFAAVIVAGIALALRQRGNPVSTAKWPIMGTVAKVSTRGGDAREIAKPIAETYVRLDRLLSAWDPTSELCRLVEEGRTNWLETASEEVRPCYRETLLLQKRSGNAFNPEVGAKLRALGVGSGCYSAFDLGAIAKGFAVDRAYETIKDEPTETLIDLGGNLRAVKGVWKTGVRNPFGGKPAAVIDLAAGESAATSGNYERFIEREGVRYSHILDGRTGDHVTGIAGVTVVTPPEYGAILADGLSTTLFVLGPKDGMKFLAAHYPKTLALWMPDTPANPRILANDAMAKRLVASTIPVEIIH